MDGFITADEMIWLVQPGRVEALGILPRFLSPLDPRPAREQLHHNYLHGGGWQPFSGFKLNSKSPVEDWELVYPGDPAMKLVGYTHLRDERIAVFDYSWVAIVAADGAYEIARMD